MNRLKDNINLNTCLKYLDKLKEQVIYSDFSKSSITSFVVRFDESRDIIGNLLTEPEDYISCNTVYYPPANTNGLNIVEIFGLVHNAFNIEIGCRTVKTYKIYSDCSNIIKLLCK